jgi:hypothetical protein
LNSKLRGVDLVAELTTVLRTGADIEREVKVEADQKSHAVLMRIRAYRMADGGIDRRQYADDASVSHDPNQKSPLHQRNPSLPTLPMARCNPSK